MDELLPLAPGCRAICTTTVNCGQEVFIVDQLVAGKVYKLNGRVFRCESTPDDVHWWLCIGKDLLSWDDDLNIPLNDDIACLSEDMLLRIDGRQAEFAQEMLTQNFKG